MNIGKFSLKSSSKKLLSGFKVAQKPLKSSPLKLRSKAGKKQLKSR